MVGGRRKRGAAVDASSHRGGVLKRQLATARQTPGGVGAHCRRIVLEPRCPKTPRHRGDAPAVLCRPSRAVESGRCRTPPRWQVMSPTPLPRPPSHTYKNGHAHVCPPASGG